MQKKVHSPPRSDWDLVATSGSQDGLCKACEMLLSGEPDGEPVLIEEYVYTGALAVLDPYRPRYLGVAADEKGMRADKLREAIEGCDPARRPRFMYVNPTGANPTGKVLPEERKREIYRICCEHNILILEDDPYYYMQFGEKEEPSFFSMDTEGRVLRYEELNSWL